MKKGSDTRRIVEGEGTVKVCYYHGTSKYCAAKIRKEGFDLKKGLKKKQSGTYGDAVSLTDSLALAKRFSKGGLVTVELDEGIRLYEMSEQEERALSQEEKKRMGEELRKEFDGILFELPFTVDAISGREWQIFDPKKIRVRSTKKTAQ